MGMLLPRINVNHFNKSSFNFSYVPVLIRWRFNDEFSKAWVIPEIPYCLATSFFSLPFCNSFNASYFTFRVTSWCFLLTSHFVSDYHQQLNSKKLWNLKTFEYSIALKHSILGIRIYYKLLRLWSNIRITWWKSRPGDLRFFRFWWFFELFEFELKEFSSQGLLLNSEGTEEFVRFRWAFDL